ncbi:MAG: alkaline phosphatase family protein [Candidatus Acidiferrum sp.]
MASPDPIKHVVVLMMENHSFDQMLGCMQQIYPNLEGVDEKNLRSNPDYPDGKNAIAQNASKLMASSFDPLHDHLNVMRQIANNCGGFVADFVQSYSQCGDTRQQVMSYYQLGSLPVLHELATNFMVCDHWFSSLPGPTWPNRFFVHTGTSKGHVKMPTGMYVKNEYFFDQNTIYNELENKNISWSIYHHGMPHTLLLARLWDKPDHFHRMDNFFKDAAGPEGDFPQYVFIEPSYGGPDENDQHPPTDLRKGEYLIAQVYNALRQNDALWNSTLFVLLYDEHGGFYDHVYPPKATPPDRDTSEFAFDQYGLRVPAILISPWVERGFNPGLYDHTSLLRYLITKWSLRPDTLGARVANAGTFTSELQKRTTPRSDTPAPFDTSVFAALHPMLPNATNEHQNALMNFAHFLEQKMSHVEELSAVGYRSLQTLGGPLEQLSVAKDRFLLYLHHGQAGRLRDNSN